MVLEFLMIPDLNVMEMPPLSRSLPFVLISVYFVVFLISAFRLLVYNYTQIDKNKTLENKILETQLQIKKQELQNLKSQIHPHFLFNTLNTIYGLALKQSPLTPGTILKLSNLLDYILYQVNKPLVSLKDEILHLKEYIDLETIRFQDTLIVSFRSSPISKEILVAPMLLVPFLENAFKHGNIIKAFLIIDIDIKLQNNILEFSIINSAFNKSENKNGIGLINIRKRLNLHYSDNYQLSVTYKDNQYIVNLKINLQDKKNV